MLIILTGKTASGKDTVMSSLLAHFPNLKRVVTTTSRQPRMGERSGIDYHFVSREIFLEKITKGEFIEHVEYGGNLYGTEKLQIADNLDKDLIWRIDPSRAGQIRQFIKSSLRERADQILKDLLVIYLMIDDSVSLQRLKIRGLSQDQIDKRLQEDQAYWDQYKDQYDFVINNVPGQLKQTMEQVIKLIETRSLH